MADVKSRKLVSVLMEPELYQRLTEAAAKADLKMSVWVRHLIRKELDRP